MKTSKIEYTQDTKGQWYFRVRGKNGRILNHKYNTERACLAGISALVVAVIHAPAPVKVKK